MPRYEVQLDDDTMRALRAIAQADDRTAAGTVRHLIRAEATRRALWKPSKPVAVPESIRKGTGIR